ncbi:MAG: serine/threonine-protein kinase [Myxococcota bacterium]
MCIGRFVVLGTLGQGGMGTVYEAFDRSLDRRVAVKVLHRDTADQYYRRLLGEAKALAQLTHPNVVTVHEVGEFEGQLFVAMELVTGRTLREWVKQQPRPTWRQCVETYCQAGSGLAAAHAAGLVHRDFKPGNAMVDAGGRVRVLDFGLAQTANEAREHANNSAAREATADRSPSHEPELNQRLTETGQIMGTPAYMPPEQMRGEEVDARSDQFSFCVALYEAIYETRPFEGQTWNELVKSVTSGKTKPRPRSSAPGRLRHILMRGLATDASQRWPSMADLLAELQELVAPKPLRWLAPLAISGGLALIGVGLARYAAVGFRCEGSMSQLAEIWDEERRHQVRDAIFATPRSYAKDTWERVEARLDEYAQDWIDKHTAVCEATRVTQDQSEEVMDLRMSCLGGQRAALHATVEVLAQANAETVDNAMAMVDGLPSLLRCDDVSALRERLPLPSNPEHLRQIETSRAEVASAEALARSGRLDEAVRAARAGLRYAQEISYRPAEATAGLVLGQALELEGSLEQARATLVDAEIAAEIARDDPTLAEIRIALVRVEGDRLIQAQKGHMWARKARAIIERIGGAPHLEAVLEHNIALVLDHEARPEDVLVHQRRAVTLAEQAGVSELRLASMYNSMAGTLAEVGQFEEALERTEQARLTWEKLLGARHHRVATALSMQGYIHQSQGNNREALRWYERGYDQMVAELGTENPQTVDTLTNVAICQAELGQLDTAERNFRRVLMLQQRAFGSEHVKVAQGHENLGAVLSRQGRPEDSLVQHRRALALKEQNLGHDHAQVANSLESVANALEKLGQAPEALTLRQRSLEICERVYGPKHPMLTVPLSNTAQNHRALGNLDQALALAEHAVQIADSRSIAPIDRSFAQLVLALVLSDRNENLERARELFEEAQRAFVDQDAPSERYLLSMLAKRHGWPITAPPSPTADGARRRQ